MAKQVRLDKYLADMGFGTRSEVKKQLKKGHATVDGIVVKNGDIKISIDSDDVFYDGKPVKYVSYEYYMLNKPAGVVSATIDNLHETVIDLIETSARGDLYPVGRLDIDTEGLLIITNDGEMAHRLLSPKKHVGKTYYARVEGNVTEADVKIFSNGIEIENGFTTLPAQLKILSSGEISEIELTIYEGKFHQVKRMFQSLEKEVIYLKRLSMGDLKLDDNLAVGEYRRLTDDELLLLKE